MLRLTKTAPGETHEEIFLARYSKLRGWALALTNRDHDRAEDLVHDAYIQFTFTRPDINAIGNLNGYFYTMLRNLHLSQVRRLERLQRRTLSIVDYDSAELGLRVVDPRQQIRIQDELRRVCQFACVRKETSKAGSVLILRFLHGYYPKEIALIMRTTRQAVEERLRTARNEARQYLKDPDLKDPGSLHFIRSSSVALTSPTEMGFARTSDELLIELRDSIFSSCEGECPALTDLKQLYNENSSLDHGTLAHIVSCRNCLDGVTHASGTTVGTVLSGIAESVQVFAGAGPRFPVFTNFSMYAQDTTRITTRMTLTYGIRWDFNPPPSVFDGF